MIVQLSVVLSAIGCPEKAIFGELLVLIFAYSDVRNTRWIGSSGLVSLSST